MNIFDKIIGILICLHIFILPLSPNTFKVRGIVYGDITLLLIISFYCLSLIGSNRARKKFIIGIKDFFSDYLSRFMIVLMTIMFISVIYSIEKRLALSETLRFILYIILFFIIKYELDIETMQKNILKSYIIVSAMLGMLGIAQYLFKYKLADVYGIKRITSTLDNPNNLGAFLILIIFPVIVLALAEKNKLYRVVYTFITIILLINIVLAGSRSSFIAFALGGIILAFALNRKLLIPLGVLGGLSLFIPAIGNRIRDIGNFTQNISRIKLWQLSVRMIKEHPFLGVGNGNFVAYYDIYIRKYPELESGWHKRYPAHNSYLKVTSELGIIGITVFLGIIICSIIKVKRLLFISEDKFIKAFYLGFLPSMLAFFFMNLTDNLFFVPKTTTFFWIAIALCDSVYFNKKIKNYVFTVH